MNIIKCPAIILAAAFLPLAAPADVLVKWDTSGFNGMQEETPPLAWSSAVTPTGIKRGAGFTAGTASTFSQKSMAFYLKPDVATLDDAIRLKAYFEIIIEPTQGATLSIHSLSFSSNRASSRSGPNALVVRSSLDGFAADLMKPFRTRPLPQSGDQTVLFKGKLDKITKPFALRVYGFGNKKSLKDGILTISNHSRAGGIVLEGTATGVSAGAAAAVSNKTKVDAESLINAADKKNNPANVKDMAVAKVGSAVADVTTPAALPEANLGRIILNDDGDYTYIGNNAEEWRANLSNMLSNMREIPAHTLAYSLATGTDLLLYPSKAGSSWGWRPLELSGAARRFEAFIAAIKHGFDGVRWAAEDARKMGMAFVPVFRVNDAHYASLKRPWFEGEFWTKNREKFTFDKPPYTQPKLAYYKELLDYSHPEVREHRLGVIREAIERYSDIMDGFFLDCMRTPLFFPHKDVPAKTPLLTAFVKTVREALDKAEPVRGRRIPLIVRVPPGVKNCEVLGMDIRRWISQNLVQVVIPAPLMTLSHDDPLQDFVTLAKPHGVKVYASLLQRTSYTYGFRKQAPVSADYTDRHPDAAHVRGAVMNGLSVGVDGFEIYNYNLPMNTADVVAFKSCLEGADNTAKPRTYVVTPSYYFDHLNTYEPRKQIPFVLTDKEKIKTIGLYIGEDPKAIDPGAYVGIRLGFACTYEEPPVHVRINGINVSSGGEFSTSKPTAKQGAKYFYQITLPNPGLVLKKGWNTVQIYPRDPSNRLMPVSELQLGVIPPMADGPK